MNKFLGRSKSVFEHTRKKMGGTAIPLLSAAWGHLPMCGEFGWVKFLVHSDLGMASVRGAATTGRVVATTEPVKTSNNNNHPQDQAPVGVGPGRRPGPSPCCPWECVLLSSGCRFPRRVVPDPLGAALAVVGPGGHVAVDKVAPPPPNPQRHHQQQSQSQSQSPSQPQAQGAAHQQQQQASSSGKSGGGASEQSLEIDAASHVCFVRPLVKPPTEIGHDDVASGGRGGADGGATQSQAQSQSHSQALQAQVQEQTQMQSALQGQQQRLQEDSPLVVVAVMARVTKCELCSWELGGGNTQIPVSCESGRGFTITGGCFKLFSWADHIGIISDNMKSLLLLQCSIVPSATPSPLRYDSIILSTLAVVEASSAGLDSLLCGVWDASNLWIGGTGGITVVPTAPKTGIQKPELITLSDRKEGLIVDEIHTVSNNLVIAGSNSEVVHAIFRRPQRHQHQPQTAICMTFAIPFPVKKFAVMPALENGQGLLVIVSPDNHTLFICSLKDLLPSIIRAEHSLRHGVLEEQGQVWAVPLDTAFVSLCSVEHVACVAPDMVLVEGQGCLYCYHNIHS
ncbi:hypothetical protein Pelo_11735 [Pelomyxa schiedti]|nr:hypothetical protein Pelo_11735 [Pelomyxa schiedti]